ncbi:serine protease inhibitor 28Dc-like isoform X2 [Toxorhynchites rutilus septentrionalis]|uniref:serine protease inhibitor 28Dc-like isoform X2 n=1 Tax=Toxorhynchites rutilus septentrionalis TaxID=329112 RepID=UPI00247A7804|nr:serine protease inhibitor 28Dc-like isoform X2 [Toxorhynchites rutilus septentrionalis]
MWLNYTLAIFLLVIAHDASGQNQAAILNPRSSQTLDVVANSVTNLAQKISLAIANPKSKTEIFSPVSIAGALSLLLLGSGGTTKEELMKLMGFQNEQISFTDIHKSFGKLFRELVSNEPTLQVNVPWRETDKCNNVDYDEYESRIGSQSDRQRRDADIPSEFERFFHQIELANGIFVENSYELNPQYTKAANELYEGNVEKLDFFGHPYEATEKINAWINENTHGKIPQMFPAPLGTNTAMIITSALYFKSLWEIMFIEGGTKLRDFYPNGRNDSAIKVNMMAHGGCFPFYNSPELDASILGIPYKNNLTTMYIIKPNNSNREVLQDLIARLNSVAINEMIKRMRRKTAVVLFPKMHISSTFNLKKTLQILGARSMFNAPKSDFSGMTGNSKLASTLNPMSESSTADRPIVNLPQLLNKKKPAGNSQQLVFSRFDNDTETSNPTESPETAETTLADETDSPAQTTQSLAKRHKRNVSYKTASEAKGHPEPLSGKDFFLNKRIVKPVPGKKVHRSRRQTSSPSAQQLFVSDAVHKVDLEINERGTEGGAATAITLNRSGTSVVFRADGPFLLVIMNDKTKLPLFFGAVYEPTE